MQIEKVIYNEDFPYNPSLLQYDIAILKLTSPLEFNDDVKPACMPTEEMNSVEYSNDDCYISGWGRSSKYNKLDNLVCFSIRQKIGSFSYVTFFNEHVVYHTSSYI